MPILIVTMEFITSENVSISNTSNLSEPNYIHAKIVVVIFRVFREAKFFGKISWLNICDICSYIKYKYKIYIYIICNIIYIYENIKYKICIPAVCNFFIVVRIQV